MSKFSLVQFNTFSIPAHANKIVVVEHAMDFSALWSINQKKHQPFLILGEGSNVLFLADFNGTVVLNRIKGIKVEEKNNGWRLHVGSGENWHKLVCSTLELGIPGLENLALIPGCVGSAPIQNIGAYGKEFKDICEYVDVLNMETAEIIRLSADECQFGYRDSIFKHKYKTNFVIVAVGLFFVKDWKPVINYGDLKTLSSNTCTPRQIFEKVCDMRISKLPDPKIIGNAGSFFKNPVVSSEEGNNLLLNYPSAPHYIQPNGDIKFAAGWLIEQCGLKGFQMGGAAVHEKQALVLINKDQATGEDIVNLARCIRLKVSEKFNVYLEPEVRFISSVGEINAVECLS